MKIVNYFKKDIVLTISLILAIITSLFNHDFKSYLTFIDFHTLGLLFSLMLIMQGLNSLGLFKLIANKLLSKIKDTRSLEAILILLCFFASMIITNDVSLITFVPLGLIIMNLVNYKHKLRVVVMQTIAANLGSMLLPIGNPQNLFLYSKFNVSFLDFVLITLPYTLTSLFLILIYLFRIKKEKLDLKLEEDKKKLSPKTYLYLAIFLISLLTVLKLVDLKVLLIVVILTFLISDRSLFKKVDYNLLLTFIFFFIFIGNIKLIPEFNNLLLSILEEKEVIVSVLASQVISNVPCAILLASFTSDFTSLIIGTNIGGLGTMIASMASLISYKLIVKDSPKLKSKYFKMFTIYNLIFLVILLGLSYII